MSQKNKILALYGGEKTRETSFSQWPYSNYRECELLNEVLISGNWCRKTGNKTEEFEKQFAKEHGANHCLCVTNGTHALEIALSTLDINIGDEVILPAITSAATIRTVVKSGAIPILIDVDLESYTMQVEAFEKAITPKTKAVIPVHLAGHACDMEHICLIARTCRFKVIEDASHSHGGTCDGKKLGSYGDISIYSFQTDKIMTCGEGGAMLIRNKNIYEKAYLIHNLGCKREGGEYQYFKLDSNYRISEFQAAVLLAQLERLSEQNRKRENNANVLCAILSTIQGISPQMRLSRTTLMTYALFMFKYESSYFNGMSRAKFIEMLNAEGIPAFPCFPIDSTNVENFSIPNARELAESVVYLPHYTLLGNSNDLEDIGTAIQKIQKYTQ